MKRIEKKFIAMIFVMAFSLSLGIAAFAADGDITVGGAGNTDYPATDVGLNKALADIQAGKTIYLAEDVLVDDHIPITNAFDADEVVIDGQGNKIIATDNFKVNYKPIQGVFNIRALDVSITFKNMTIDANKKAGYCIYMYRSGDYMGGQLTIEDVTLKDSAVLPDGSWFGNFGGYGVLVNTSTLIATRPVSIGNPRAGFNVDRGGSIPDGEFSRLEINGQSTYDTEISSFWGVAGRGKYVNIVAESGQKDVIIKDNGKVVNPLNSGTPYYELAGNEFVLNPDPKPTEDEYKHYMPWTVETFQYDTNSSGKTRYGSKPAKMKTEDFQFVKETKYNWGLEKTGSLSSANKPHYDVKLTCVDKEVKYYLKGKVWVKNFRQYENATGKVKISVDGYDDKEFSFDLAPDAEEVETVVIPVDENFVPANDSVSLTLEEPRQFDITREVPALALTEKEVDKSVTVLDDHYTFEPAFTETWAEGGVFDKSYKLDKISEELTNIVSIVLEDGSKIEKSVTLDPKNNNVGGEVVTTERETVTTSAETSEETTSAPSSEETTSASSSAETTTSATTSVQTSTASTSANKSGAGAVAGNNSQTDITDIILPGDAPLDNSRDDIDGLAGRLPQTGGLPLSLMMVIGSSVAGAGLIIKSKK